MRLIERLRAIVEAVPAGGVVSLPRDWLAAELDGPAGVVSSDNNGARPALDAKFLTVAEAAAALGVSRTWLYRHAARLPFAHRLGPRTLRFDTAGLAAWAARRRGS